MRKLFIAAIFISVLVSCSTPTLYRGHSAKRIPLVTQDNLFCTPVDEQNLRIQVFRESWEGVLLAVSTEEGYYAFPYFAKTTEMIFWFPLSIVFYPVPFFVPITPDRVSPVDIPLRLIDPSRSIAYGIGPATSAGHVIEKRWKDFEGMKKRMILEQEIYVIVGERQYLLRTDARGHLKINLPQLGSASEVKSILVGIQGKNPKYEITTSNYKITDIRFLVDERENSFSEKVIATTPQQIDIEVIPSVKKFHRDTENYFDIITSYQNNPISTSVVVAMGQDIFRLSTDNEGKARLPFAYPSLSFRKVPSVYSKKFSPDPTTYSIPVFVWAIEENGLHGKHSKYYLFDYPSAIQSVD